MSDAKPKILVTRRLPDAVEARIARDYDAVTNPTDRPYSMDEIVSGAAGCTGVLCAPTEAMNAETIARLPKSVAILATFSVGFDHIDLEAAAARGLIVTNTPDVLTDATADLTMLLMLGAARRAFEGQKMLYRMAPHPAHGHPGHRQASGDPWHGPYRPRRGDACAQLLDGNPLLKHKAAGGRPRGRRHLPR
jgi:lactate dehydrogenase-like 2-hydroxyacid dehydrogenase